MDALREAWGINAKQIFLMTLAVVGATEILTEPDALSGFAGQDAWMAPLIGLAVGVIPLLFWYALDRRWPGLTLTEQARAALGPVFGAIVLLPLLLLFVTALGSAERIVSEIIAAISLPRTPDAVVITLLVLPVVLIVRMGPEVLGRMADVLVPVAVIGLLLLAALGGRDAKVINLMPVLARGWRPVLQAGLMAGGFFSPTVALLYILPFRGCSRRTALGAALLGLGAGAFLLSLTTAVGLLIFGALGPILAVPFLQVARIVELSEFLTHLDPLFVVIWEAFSFIKVGIYVYVLCMSVSQLLGLKDYRPLTLPVGAFTVIAASTWFDSAIKLRAFTAQAVPFLGLVQALPVPALVWAVTALRGAGRKRRQGSADKRVAA